MKNEKFLEVDITAAYSLLQLNNVIIDHINELISSNFKNIESYDIKTLIIKATPTKMGNVKPEQIFARLASNNKKLDELVKKSQGLKWYNQAVRFVDDWVITPCQKYSIPRRVLLTAGIVAATEVFFWEYAHKRHEAWHRPIMIGGSYDTVLAPDQK